MCEKNLGKILFFKKFFCFWSKNLTLRSLFIGF